jgi:hypothetical protein
VFECTHVVPAECNWAEAVVIAKGMIVHRCTGEIRGQFQHRDTLIEAERSAQEGFAYPLVDSIGLRRGAPEPRSGYPR